MNLAEQMRELSEKAEKGVDISKWLEKIKEAALSGKKSINIGRIHDLERERLESEGFIVKTGYYIIAGGYVGTISW